MSVSPVTEHFRCCVVGGGPAGVILSYLLARHGVSTVLLEAHHDFDRDFRGDTVHPATLDVLHDLGLAEKLHQLPHGKMRRVTIHAGGIHQPLVDLSVLGCRYPYIMMISQALFLDFLVKEAQQFPSFTLKMGARVQHVIREQGVIRGVTYQDAQGTEHQITASLVVAADGRFSKLRALAGLQPDRTSPPMDVVWFRVPREAGDVFEEGAFYLGSGRVLVLLTRETEWQAGFVIPKGSFQKLKADGLPAMRTSVRELVPWIGPRMDTITDWSHFSVLSVESSRLPTWHVPGMLCIGDAAHVMSPVGGVGINYAVQDAVEAANVLADPLKHDEVNLHHLSEVQRRREWPVKVIQTLQSVVQQRVVCEAFQMKEFQVPFLLRMVARLRPLQWFPARMVAYGASPARVEI